MTLTFDTRVVKPVLSLGSIKKMVFQDGWSLKTGNKYQRNFYVHVFTYTTHLTYTIHLTNEYIQLQCKKKTNCKRTHIKALDCYVMNG